MSFRRCPTLLTSLGALAAVGVLVAACGSDAKPAPAGEGGDSGVLLADGSTDGSTNADGAGSDAAADGSAVVCNALVAGGAPLVPQVLKGGALPTASGGAISLGTYLLTERDIYGGTADGLFIQRKLVIDAAKINAIEGTSTTATGSPALTTSTSSYQVFGTIGLSMRESCPGAPTVTNAHFSADATKLMLYNADLGTAEVYTLQ